MQEVNKYFYHILHFTFIYSYILVYFYYYIFTQRGPSAKKGVIVGIMLKSNTVDILLTNRPLKLSFECVFPM